MEKTNKKKREEAIYYDHCANYDEEYIKRVEYHNNVVRPEVSRAFDRQRESYQANLD